MSDQQLRVVTDGPAPMVVEIDGVRYELQSPDSFGVGALMRIDRMATRLRYLLVEISKEDPQPAAEAELPGLLERFVTTVMPELPDAVRAKLKDAHKLAIITAYKKWFAGPFVKTTGASESTRSSGGPDESPGSDASMAEAGKTG